MINIKDTQLWQHSLIKPYQADRLKGHNLVFWTLKAIMPWGDRLHKLYDVAIKGNRYTSRVNILYEINMPRNDSPELRNFQCVILSVIKLPFTKKFWSAHQKMLLSWRKEKSCHLFWKISSYFGSIEVYMVIYLNLHDQINVYIEILSSLWFVHMWCKVMIT